MGQYTSDRACSPRVPIGSADGGLRVRSLLASAEWRCVPVRICGLLLLVFMFSCSHFDEKAHIRFAPYLSEMSAHVQAHSGKYGNLPATRDEVQGWEASSAVAALVQYKSRGVDEYLLWICVDDLAELDNLPSDPSCSSPERGDIFARYRIDGSLIVASWDCDGCAP